MVKKTPHTTARTTFTRFYFVMLILSTIGTTVSALSLFSIPTAINEFHIAPLYSSAVLALSAITLVSIVALVLLWKKKVEGFYLKIGSYVAAIIATIVAMVGVAPYAAYLIEDSNALNSSEAQELGVDVVKSIYNGIFYFGLGFSIVIMIVFMTLWIFAWRKQVAEDK